MSDNAYADYIHLRYQGEVLGEAAFGAMAAQREDVGERAKLTTLAQLERETKEALRPEVDALQLSTEGDAKKAEEGRALAQQLGNASWADVLRGLCSEIERLIPEFEAAERLAPPGKEALLRHVTAHERALLDFAQAELAGDAGGDSLRSVSALLRANA